VKLTDWKPEEALVPGKLTLPPSVWMTPAIAVAPTHSRQAITNTRLQKRLMMCSSLAFSLAAPSHPVRSTFRFTVDHVANGVPAGPDFQRLERIPLTAC
jgi:hypothetical protein